MQIHTLKHREAIRVNTRLSDMYVQLAGLLKELDKHVLPETLVDAVNRQVNELNALPDEEHILRKQLRKKQMRIVKQVEKEARLVPKNYYRNLWLAIGMASFGIPLGLVFGLALGNMAFIGIGFPIGLAIGVAVGTGMDRKAQEQGRQLDVEVRY